MTPTTLAAAMHRAGVGQHHNPTGSPYPYREVPDGWRGPSVGPGKDCPGCPRRRPQGASPTTAQPRGPGEPAVNESLPEHVHGSPIVTSDPRCPRCLADFHADTPPVDAQPVEPLTAAELAKFRESVRLLGDEGTLQWTNNVAMRLLATLDAARAGDGLDVERLRKAIQGHAHHGARGPDCAEGIARLYDAAALPPAAQDAEHEALRDRVLAWAHLEKEARKSDYPEEYRQQMRDNADEALNDVDAYLDAHPALLARYEALWGAIEEKG